ncbi:hypothetical protein N9937_02355 [bacterium]|nr:hypothetical protein [bacterium]
MSNRQEQLKEFHKALQSRLDADGENAVVSLGQCPQNGIIFTINSDKGVDEFAITSNQRGELDFIRVFRG